EREPLVAVVPVPLAVVECLPAVEDLTRRLRAERRHDQRERRREYEQFRHRPGPPGRASRRGDGSPSTATSQVPVARSASATGSVTRKTAPAPSVLSTAISPPCSTTI